jgi:hypothetical protein
VELLFAWILRPSSALPVLLFGLINDLNYCQYAAALPRVKLKLRK